MRSPNELAPLLISSLLLAACPGDGGTKPGPADAAMSAGDVGASQDTGTPKTDVTPDAAGDDASSTDTGTDSLAEAASLMSKLGGLWVGTAAQTPLGEFPVMPMDFRAADENVLFARVDLDAQNALRMAFFVEEIDGEDQLVFRNGGLFMGLSRDTKTVLVDHDPASATWRFCEPQMGCEYVDTIITFDGDDALTMDTKVRGQQHMIWTPRRVETRALPSPFPATLDPIGTGDAEFPPMPTLDIELSWSDPAPAGASVWVILSDTPCGLTGQDCQASRSIGQALEEGDTTATLQIEQLHAGDYHLNAILDRDGNFRTSPRPNTGDAIIFPVDPTVTVPADGASTSHTISFDVP